MDPPKSHNILIIDRDIGYAPLIEQILANDFSNMSDIFWFEDEEAVMDFLSEKTPPIISIVLLDIENSEIDGIAILKRLKDKSSSFKNIPLIIFSRLQDLSVIKQCFILGANSWVHKPRDLKKIRKNLELICQFWLTHTILPSSLT